MTSIQPFVIALVVERQAFYDRHILRTLETLCKLERGESFLCDFQGDVCTKVVDSWKNKAWSVVANVVRGQHSQWRYTRPIYMNF
jgi:hypothetical protein